jgi:hypothetical protein
MARAAAETGAAQKAATILNIDHAIAMGPLRDAPMRGTRCRRLDLPSRYWLIERFPYGIEPRGKIYTK